MELLEHIGLDDYKRLEKLRVRNYITIIKMFYRVYKSHEMEKEIFDQLRTRLLQIRQLLKYLSIDHEYKRLYERVVADKYVFGKEEDLNKTPQIMDEHACLLDEETFVDLDEEEGNLDHDSEAEYEEYYSRSCISNYHRTYERFELLKEEKKWVKRAIWLQEKLQLLRCDTRLIKWFAWFQAKMDSLVDLDVNIDTESTQQSSQVFYMAEFVDQQIQKPDPSGQYEKEQKIYCEPKNFYPKIDSNSQEINNDSYPVLKAWTEVREKLCLKIRTREQQTDYFVSIFKRKAFGNEKIYEKRINFRNKILSFNNTCNEFSPCGNYFLWKFNINYEEPQYTLIFSLNAKYKDPLLIKPFTKNIGFFNGKYYCYQESKQKIIEYDLQDYNNVQKHKVEYCINDLSNLYLTQNGWVFIQKNYTETGDESKRVTVINFEIWVKNEKYILEQQEQLTPEQNPEIKINQKGDRILLHFWKEGRLNFSQFLIDKKSQTQVMTALGGALGAKPVSPPKLFKKEFENFVQQPREQFEIEMSKINITVVPLLDDFVVMYTSTKLHKILIYYEFEYITEYETENIQYITLKTKNDGTLDGIYFDDNNYYYEKNMVQYSICQYQESQQEKKFEWKWQFVQHNIHNFQQYMCYPYFYYIYNHDQVYMKDISKPKMQGLYYMNGFLGIESGTRPLTVFGMRENNKTVLMVPSINSSYSKKHFLMKIHSIKSKNQNTDRYRFAGYIRYRIYACNQDMIQVIRGWMTGFSSNQIVSNIQITNKHNGLAIEKLEQRKVTSRLIMTYYSTPLSESRDITDESADLSYRSWERWLFILQRKNDVVAYTKDVRYSFRLQQFLELDAIWNYSVDEQSGEIYDILIDNMQNGQVDLYLLMNDATLKRFYGKYSNSLPIETFTEDSNIYSIEPFFVKKGAAAGAGGSGDKGGNTSTTGGTKRVGLWDIRADIFVANRVLYSQEAIVDFSVIKPNEKTQFGQVLLPYFSNKDNIKKLTFAVHEAKIVAVYNCGYIARIVITPLLNSRQIPLFHQQQFTHPVVPQVDKERGFTQVFTLSIDNRILSWNELTHARLRKKQYQFQKMVNPGFIIKYFNGIEDRISLLDFGEEYESILRFKQSLNGKYVIIVGTRYGKFKKESQIKQEEEKLNPLSKLGDSLKKQVETLVEQKHDERVKQKEQGMFLYEIGLGTIQLVNAFLFAEKDPKFIEEEINKKMNLVRKTIPEYIKPELLGNSYLEYNNDYTTENSYDFHCRFYPYETSIDFATHDEEILAQKKIKEWRESDLLVAKKNNKGWGSSKMDVSIYEDDEYYKQRLEQDEDYKKIVRLTNLVERFPGFNIPVFDDIPYGVNNLEQFERQIYLIQEKPNPEWENKIQNLNEDQKQQEEEKYNNYFTSDPVTAFNPEEKEKITKIHNNYHLELNDEGDIFLIERLHNKLYYFFRNQQDQQYYLHKKKFDQDFQITAADSSKDFLVVNSENRFQVFKLERNANPQKLISPLAIENNPKNKSLLFDSNPPKKEEKKKEEAKQGEEQKEEEKKEEAKQALEQNYEVSYIQIKIKDKLLVMRVRDSNSFYYVKIFDVENQINRFYIEGKKVAISGDNQYLWDLEKNQVLDIVNGLSTFFVWTSNPISMQNYDSMDLFNVLNDRSIMITQGYLELAFDFISIQVDKELNDNFSFKNNILDSTKCFKYMYYKIGNNKSILERIFKEDRDKLSLGESPPEPRKLDTEKLQKEEEERLMNVQSNQYKQLSVFLNFLTEYYSVEVNDPLQITHFFFSYYYIQDGQYLNLFQKMFIPEEARQDLIDDMLHYVVNTDIPTLQYVVNTSFLRFLKSANTSIAFQSYLNNITKQTTTMKELEKFQMPKTDEGFFVESHNSPIMDNDFQRIFRDPEQPKKDVSIYYINLGEILSKEGKEIMDVLSDKDYLSMMNIPFIQYLVMYQWLNVRNTIQKRLLLPFFILLGLYFFYATFQIDWYKDYEEERINQMTAIVQSTENDPNATQDQINRAMEIEKDLKMMLAMSSNFSVLWLLNVIGLLGILTYLYFMEAKQFIKEPREYFGEFWNIIDIFNYTLCYCVIFMDIINASIQIVRPTASVCVIILWIKLFYFLRVFETTSKLVRMIIEIVNDMKNFLIVLGIGVLGFANGLYILSQNQKDGIEPFAGQNFVQALIYTYRLALGDFQADEFYNLYPIDVIIVWTIFIIASLFVVIVLLNLLIAIMGDTFSRVLENITNLTVREKVMLVSENEALFDRDQKFKNSQYLIIIKEKSLEASQTESWDGQINALKRQLMDKLQLMQSGIDQRITENSNEMKKRFTDFDDKSKRGSLLMEQKIASISKNEIESMYGRVKNLFDSMAETIIEQNYSIQNLQEQLRDLQSSSYKIDNVSLFLSKFRKDVYKNLKITPEDKEDDISEGEE